ncbi:PilZ domain-containing protein [Pseudomonas lalucatii]|nr:PilZ domain-containing protein [Pseudomonas lalucatii]
MSLPPNLGPRNGILSLTIKDKSVLYAAYMPFIKNGGLFIPTNKSYKLGDEVFMLLNLMDEPEKIPVAGKVVWITPRAPRATAPRAWACSSTRATTPRATRSKPTWRGP